MFIPPRVIDEMKLIFDALMLSALYVGGVLTLNDDVTYILTITGASVAGSVVLAYFRRDLNHREVFFKAACSSLCGLVAGAVITKRYEIKDVEYIVAIYFFGSLLSLFFIKGLLSFAESNASNVIITILQRFIPPANNKNDPRSPLSITPSDDEQATVVTTEIEVSKDGEVVEQHTTKEGK